MTNITKPSDINKIWAATGDKHSPDDAKIALGYIVEIPTLQQFNWMINKIDQSIAHINQHGVPIWDDVTEYQAGTSWVQGSDGNIYPCKVTNTNQNPTTDTTFTYWGIPIYRTGAGPEQTPTLSNSWTNVSLRYRFFNNSLHIYGSISGGTRTDGTTTFTLPTAYRPTAARRASLTNIASGAGPSYSLIGTDGTVKIYNTGASGDLFFDSVIPL